MENYQTINVDVHRGAIGVITLTRQKKRNALSIEMRREISSCLAAWRDDSHISSLIITGAGPVFCSGFDLDEFRQSERHDELVESSFRCHRDLFS